MKHHQPRSRLYLGASAPMLCRMKTDLDKFDETGKFAFISK